MHERYIRRKLEDGCEHCDYSRLACEAQAYANGNGREITNPDARCCEHCTHPR